MNKIKQNGSTLLLSVILLAIFVVPSSISGTAIALPSISRDTQAPLTSLQWVVNAFNLAFACFTLAWGAFADNFGRRTCFMIGVALYSIASLISAFAPNPWILDVGRCIAGIGAAAVFSVGIAILSVNYSGTARLRVFALFGTTAGLGVSLGPTISGLLLDAFDWRSIFLVHAFILLLVLLASPAIPKDQVTQRRQFNFDFTGSLLFIVGLLSAMIAIVESSQYGWTHPVILSLLACSILALCLFWLQETRHPNPMLDLSLLKNKPYVGFSLITVAGSFAFVTLLTYLPSYVTSVLGMSATAAGLLMLLLTAPMLVCPVLAGKLVTMGVSAKSVLIVSLLCLIVGVAGLWVVAAPAAKLYVFAVPLLLVGAGYGLAAGLVDGVTLKVVAEEKAGMAAGLLNTFRLGSEAIAVSLYGSLLASQLFRLLSPSLSEVSDLTEVKRILGEAASGNFDLLGVSSSATVGALTRNLLASSYDSAFHHVLIFLGVVTTVLTVIICLLIRENKAPQVDRLEVA